MAQTKEPPELRLEMKRNGSSAQVQDGHGTEPPARTQQQQKKQYDATEHLETPQQVAERYGVSINLGALAHSQGLTSAQVTELRAKHGLNQLTPPKEVPEIIKFLKQFANPLMLLLLVAGGLCYMAYALQSPRDKNNLILASALIVVVSATCTMSYMQERSASSVMASLRKMMPSKTLVTRDGKEVKVEAADLVPGDLVRLMLGDRVPADVRLLESAELKVECSSLTGESDLVPGTVDAKSELVEHAHNVVFMSSLIMNGEGRGIVIRTGDHTYIGSIASLASSSSSHTSTLVAEVHRLVKFVAVIAFTTAIILFAIGLGRNNVSRIEAFINGFILVIVANVPEGLPATVTSLLTLTAIRLKERNVLIKKTDIIENLGCASIIASDKTGTLTMNKMTVEHLWVDAELHEARDVRAPPTSRTTQAGMLARGSRALGRNTLNRASRRILDKVSHSKAGMGTSLAATSVALHGGAIFEDGPLPSPAAVPVGHSLTTLTEGVPTAVDAAPAELFAVSSSPAHVLDRMSLGRASTGFTALGRMKTRTEIHAGTFGERISMTRHSRMAPGTLASPSMGTDAEIADFSAFGRVSWAASNAMTRLVVCAIVCNKAKFTEGSENNGKDAAVNMAPIRIEDRPALGDATDTGLLRFVEHLVPANVVRALYKQVFSIPFNSANKWSLVVAESPNVLTEHVVLMKGAPEMIIMRCTTFTHRGVEMPVDDAFKESLMRAYERCGFLGERVIGLAYKTVPAHTAEVYQAQQEAGEDHPHTTCPPITSGLTFAGLISLVDPPRPSVPDAVSRCRRAGIRVAMVTGDHPLTAEAIARRVGIVTLKTQREVAVELGITEDQVPWDHPRVGAVVVPGSKLRELDHNDVASWDAILDHEEVVFARTTPAQKLQIVEHLQRRGEVVAVTGDGVNDSPALARAQIGVAMGKGGSDVAREAADIVLLDDEFGSIVNAVEEGRVIYDNLKKTIAYTLTHALPELVPIFFNLALSFPLGLGGLLILSVDLVTEQGPAISLAYEKPEANVMERPPRDTETERLVDARILRYAYLIAGVFESAFCMLGFMSIFWWHGVPSSAVAFGIDKGYFGTETSEASLLKTNKRCTPGEGFVCSDDGYRMLNGEQQLDVYYEAQSCWYVTLVMCQFWHIFLCRTRQVSIFKQGVFSNTTTLYGLLISLTVILGIVYIPGLHGIFATRSLTGIGWLPHFLFLIVMLPYTEYTKWCTRNHPDGWVARNLQF